MRNSREREDLFCFKPFMMYVEDRAALDFSPTFLMLVYFQKDAVYVGENSGI